MEVLLSKERILKLIQAWDDKQIESWSLPVLLLQLLNDSRTIGEMLKKHEQAVNLVVQQKQEEQAAQIFSPNWDFSLINDDEEHSIQYKEYLEKSPDVITTVLPIEEPEYSLSMGEYEVTSNDESECDVPVKDDSSSVFTNFPNPFFDDNDDFTSSDDESLSNEDVPIEEFKVYSNPLFDDEEINSDEIDPHCFNVESDFVESLFNRDTLIDSSPKFDFLEEFSGALLPTSIADEEHIRREHVEYISLIERLFTINPCPRPMENANTIVETLPSYTIPVGDNDSQREEIDIFTGTDELLPPDIESDDYDSEGDIHFIE
nr:hypothetical protein [Tanacetum cinerariifolium]